jgi:hypothetical protein
MSRRVEPSSPEQVLHYLCAVFPTFKDWWEDGETEILDAELGFHLIMAEFIQFFGVNHQSFSEKQLRRFCEWVNDAVLIDGPLKNAISTCFLEYTRRGKINRVLAPYLSRVVKDRSHA